MISQTGKAFSPYLLPNEEVYRFYMALNYLWNATLTVFYQSTAVLSCCSLVSVVKMGPNNN